LTYGQTAQQNAYLSRQAANTQQASLNKTGGSRRRRRRKRRSTTMYGGASGVADNAAPATMEIYSPNVPYKDNATGGSSVTDVNKTATQSLVTAQTNAAYDSQAGGGGSSGCGSQNKYQHGCGTRRRRRRRSRK
jgi:hypothetical protein